MRIKRKKKINIVVWIFIVMVMLLLSATYVYYNYNISLNGTKNEIKNEIILAKETPLRTGPGEEYPKIITVNSGISVEKQSESGEWIEIRTTENYVGWIPGWNVSGTEIKSPEEKMKEQLNKFSIIINPKYVKDQEDINLKVATKLKAELEKLKINVILTRTDSKEITNQEISQLITEKNASLVLNIGMGQTEKTSSGPALYYANSTSNILSKYIEKTLYNNYIFRTKTSEKNEALAKPINENIPEILLILGNYGSEIDRTIIEDVVYGRELELAISRGIEEYLYYLINLENLNEKKKEQLINSPQKGMNIPFYYTKQEAYKDIDYGTDNSRKISDNGDVIISLAMISDYLNPGNNNTVRNIVDWAGNNYYVPKQGNSPNIVPAFAKKYNYEVTAVSRNNLSKIEAALKENKPVLVQFGPGLFANKTTYKVLRGTEDNKYYINDPDDDDSKLNNYIGFTPNDIERNMLQAWIFSK